MSKIYNPIHYTKDNIEVIDFCVVNRFVDFTHSRSTPYIMKGAIKRLI